MRRNSLMILICMILLYLNALSGCSFSRGNVGDEFKHEDVAAIKKGMMRDEVISVLGAPDRILEVNAHEILQYYRYDIKAASLLLIVANFSRFNIRSDDLYVFLNRDGVVEEVVFGKRTDRMKFRFWPFGE